MASDGQSNGGKAATDKVVPEPVPQTASAIEPKARLYASIFPGPGVPIEGDLPSKIKALEEALDMPVWLVAQAGNPNGPYALLDGQIRDGFFAARDELEECGPVALVIDSRGGYATETFRLAMLIRRHCGGFVAVIPRMAKSAATLLTLGADEILMGRDAELGPLDVQVYDHETEEESSALDEVQSLERLNGVALDQLDQTMAMLMTRSGKKMSTLLPLALDFTANMMRPLLEKIDTVHYAKQSRLLKVAEDYAVRLLEPAYGKEVAKDIARRLVHGYPEHPFAIGIEEVSSFLALGDPTDDQGDAIAALETEFTESPCTIIGRIKEEEVEIERHE
jgi:hypothetical protein